MTSTALNRVSSMFDCGKPTEVGCNVRPVAVPPNMPSSFAISETLRSMLISSVACGDEKLALLISESFPVIECMSRLSGCMTPDIQLIQLQVGLADFALDAARGFVDQVKVRGTGAGETHFRGTSYRDSTAKRQSQGTSFFKSRANSANNFARTSASRESSFSTARSQADGQFTNTGHDRSRRQQNAETVSFDKAKVVGEGEGQGQSTYLSTRTSRARSQTKPNPDFTPIIPTPIAMTETFQGATIATNRYVGVFTTAPTKPTCDPADLPPDADPDICENLQPSVGAGFRSSYSINGSMSVSVGPISLAAGFEKNRTASNHFRTQHVCSSGSGSVRATSSSSIKYRQDDDSESAGKTTTDASGFVQQDVRRTGNSERTSTSKTHAESTGRMDSCGESHSSAQRKAHGEAQNTGESQGRSERHAESEIKFQSVSNILTEARYFNQIFKQLADLRKLLWERLQTIEAKSRASLLSMHACAGRRTLTAPPLFWFTNAFTCARCLSSNCGCR